jgi:hypothetical protein
MDNSAPPDRPPPLQFSLRSLFGLMFAVALIFGTLRWMNVSTATHLIVMAVLLISGLVVVLLVAAINKSQ